MGFRENTLRATQDLQDCLHSHGTYERAEKVSLPVQHITGIPVLLLGTQADVPDNSYESYCQTEAKSVIPSTCRLRRHQQTRLLQAISVITVDVHRL